MRTPLALLMVLTVLASACGDLDEASPPEIPALDELTETYGCGHGFWVGNPEQTVALRIMYLGDDKPSPDVQLPAADWNAVVVQGRDLYANWCDDVVEPDEPVPSEVATYEVVAGSLRIEGDIPEQFVGGRLTLHATGLRIALDDGATAELGDIVITNDTYGFFAG